ncbi:hypothetical protein GRI34_07870 [Erythrobacter aquimaris]|uniref:Uncharacterized protein n=1 Tax=Qipengyuania aquimaris TaxID=255984 RepID=A0A6I4TMT6_9SPHN|nr:hypothetical protein [Qipengyuania aquimaris]MXO96337.1 hypothetical protein [Qipengyuania aquimaris]
MRCLATIIAGLLSVGALHSGCAEDRLETPEFFQSKTGLAICRDAVVRNVRVGDYDHETDFTYGVRLKMSDECKDNFLEEIEEQLGVHCPTVTCSFMDANAWSYEISTLADGEINFILRAT